MRSTKFRGQIAYRIVKHLPSVIIKEPERIFIAVLAVLIGVLSLAFQSPSIEATFHPLIALEWGITLILGGLFKLTGLSMSTARTYSMSIKREVTGRSLERSGMVLIAIGSFTYAGALAIAAGTSGFVGVLTFTLLGLTNVVRLVSSTAGRAILNDSEGRSRGDI